MQHLCTTRPARAFVPMAVGLSLLLATSPAAVAQTGDDDPATNACTSHVVGTSGFEDIAGDVHADNIECIAAYDVTIGTTPQTYDPGATLTREQMATLLANVLAIAEVPLDSSTQAFTDVAGTYHEDSINAIAVYGITIGTSPGRFSPAAPVTRAQMATFLVTVDEVIGDSLPEGPDAFTDDDGDVHETSINTLAAAEIAFGTGEGRYAPGRPVTRGQMASFIARLLDRGVDVAEVPPLSFVAPELIG